MKRGFIAVVPAFSEEGTIGETVSSLLSINAVSRVIVVDDDSPDRTVAEAVRAGATVVSNGKNLGKGTSLNRLLRLLEFDGLLLIDGDLGSHAEEASLLLEPVSRGSADLSIAAFPRAHKKGGFGMVKGLSRWGISFLGGAEMRSPVSGQRAMTRRAYECLYPFAHGFGMETGMTIDALRAGLTVVEVETTMSHNETGRDLSGFLHRGRQFVDIAFALAVRMTRIDRRKGILA